MCVCGFVYERIMHDRAIWFQGYVFYTDTNTQRRSYGFSLRIVGVCKTIFSGETEDKIECEKQGHHHKKMREETRNLFTFGRIEVRTFLDFRTTDWQPTLCPFSLTYVSVNACSRVFGFHHTNATQSSPSTNLFVFVHMGGKCLAYSVRR